MAKHRVELPWWEVMVGILLVGALGAAGQWGVGRALDSVAEAATSDGPLAVDFDAAMDDWVVVPAQAHDILPAEPPTQSHVLARLAASSGGAPVEPSYGLIAYGLADTPVLIRGISAQDVACEKADGDWVGAIVEGGGAVSELPVTMTLDADSSTAEGAPMPTMDGENTAWDFPRQVSGAEAEGFLLRLMAPSKNICSLRLRIDYTSRGEEGSLVVEQDGRPFSVAAADIAEPSIVF